MVPFFTNPKKKTPFIILDYQMRMPESIKATKHAAANDY